AEDGIRYGHVTGVQTCALPISAAPLVGLSTVVVIGLLSLYGICRLNRYGFDLYLEIDAARETQSELAVMRERYRFSVDLHDIQGDRKGVVKGKGGVGGGMH